MSKVYNRKTKKVEELKHVSENALKKVYGNKTLTKIATKRFPSKVFGLYNKTFISKIKIKKFIEKNNIDMSLYEETKYKSFDDFFIRKPKKIKFSKKSTDFLSPCDAKLKVYKATKDLTFEVKNFKYTIEDLIQDKYEDMEDTYLFIYRLCVDDCHRYYYIDDGSTEKRVHIKGKFHTVSDSSSEYKIYKENEREYSILNTKNFGKIIYMEVGALMIGKIVNHDLKKFKRGEEKGYFLPGASTIIVIAKGIKVDQDILNNSKKEIETLVSIGEKVGEKKC